MYDFSDYASESDVLDANNFFISISNKHLIINLNDKLLKKDDISNIITQLNLTSGNTITRLDLVSGSDHTYKLKEGDIPNSITYLTFDKFFNQTLEKGILPNSITHLVFGFYFGQKIEKGILPDSLTHLVFGFYFSQKLNIQLNMLPPSLRILDIYLNNQILSNLPIGLEKLIIRSYNKDFYIKIPYGCILYDGIKNQILI